MNKKILVLLAAGSIASNIAFADIPHNFVNGNVADANQVNNNFTSLDTELSKLDVRIDNLEATSGTYEPERTYKYERQAVTMPLGSIVTIGGVEYKIIKISVPMYEGNDFVITLPIPISGSGLTLKSFPDFPEYHGEKIQFDLDGFQGELLTFATKTLVFNKSNASLIYTSKFDSVYLYFKAGTTVLNIPAPIDYNPFESDSGKTVAIDTSDNDLSNDLTSADMSVTPNFDTLTTYLNYIHIN